jgi:hypothetical protein
MVHKPDFGRVLVWGSKPFGEQFLDLYNIANCPHATMTNVMSQKPLNISFQRGLVGDKLVA